MQNTKYLTREERMLRKFMRKEPALTNLLMRVGRDYFNIPNPLYNYVMDGNNIQDLDKTEVI